MTTQETILPSPLTATDWRPRRETGRAWPANSNDLSVFTEEIADDAIGTIEGHWRMLEARALEGNAYFSPDFLIAAMRHFRRTTRPRLLAIWKPLPPPHAPRLIGLVPLARHRTLPFATPARLWHHPLIGYGAPLLDRFDAEAALTAMFAHLARQNQENTVVFQMLDENGATLAALRHTVRMQGGSLAMLDRTARPILTQAAGTAFGSRKRSKELGRLRRRLSDDDAVTFHVSGTYAELRNAAERFFALEAAGWKGHKGTALVQDPDSANFARAMLWSSARRDRARIAWLEKDGRMIAAMILLLSGTRAFLWKTAYDEQQARFAPGSLLLQDLTDWLKRQPDLELTDSCALPGQFLVEAHWQEHLAVCDVIVSPAPASAAGFAIMRGMERGRHRLRRIGRRLYHMLRSGT